MFRRLFREGVNTCASLRTGIRSSSSASSAPSSTSSASTSTSSATASGQTTPSPTLWNDPIPTLAKVLGFSGLIPFYLACPALVRSCEDRQKNHIPPELAAKCPQLHTAYGISIASFLGGVSWGTAIAGLKYPFFWNERLVLGVVPSLIAFPAAALNEDMGAVVTMMALFAAFYNDFHLYSNGMLPYWYMRLRIYLTVFASLSYVLRLQEPSVREFFNSIYGDGGRQEK